VGVSAAIAAWLANWRHFRRTAAERPADQEEAPEERPAGDDEAGGDPADEDSEEVFGITYEAEPEPGAARAQRRDPLLRDARALGHIGPPGVVAVLLGADGERPGRAVPVGGVLVPEDRVAGDREHRHHQADPAQHHAEHRTGGLALVGAGGLAGPA